MKRLKFMFLIVMVFVGCGKSSSDRESGPAQGSSGDPVGNNAEPATVEPVAFESVALFSDSTYESVSIADGTSPGEVREFTKLQIKFCWCPPGSFMMGSSEETPDHFSNEAQFEAKLSNGFWIQQTELTQEQYITLMGSNPAYFQRPQNPVESLTWHEATEFCRRLSELPPEKKAGNLFRLPSEAEWEYACRAGSTKAFCYGDDKEQLDDYGWYENNSSRTTHPVGEKKTNAWGLQDMHGNVSEWCADFYGDYPRNSVNDPRGPKSGDKRTLRGGGWFFVPMWARSSHRDAYVPSARYVGLGFRLVAGAAPESASESSNAKPEQP